MFEMVRARLKSFGYTLKDTDTDAVNFCIEKIKKTILNDCNLTEVPEGLIHIWVDMAVAEFLRTKKVFSPGDLANLDLGRAIASLTEGDKSTSFATGTSSLTDEQRLDALIEHLSTYGRDQFSCFRRLRW